MSRDGIPRAYLRIDPNVDQVYPELRNTFIGLLCSGHRQPDRGRYRDRRLVEALHSRPFVARCFDRGDLVTLSDGRVYIDGWDEWQEGDLTVADRMRRMRQRRRNKRDGDTVTLSSPDRGSVTTDAVDTHTSLSSGVGEGVAPPPPTRGGRRASGTNPRAIEEARAAKARREANVAGQLRVAHNNGAHADESDPRCPYCAERAAAS